MSVNIMYSRVAKGTRIQSSTPSDMWRILMTAADNDRVLSADSIPFLIGAAAATSAVNVKQELDALIDIVEREGPVRIWCD